MFYKPRMLMVVIAICIVVCFPPMIWEGGFIDCFERAIYCLVAICIYDFIVSRSVAEFIARNHELHREARKAAVADREG